LDDLFLEVPPRIHEAVLGIVNICLVCDYCVLRLTNVSWYRAGKWLQGHEWRRHK